MPLQTASIQVLRQLMDLTQQLTVDDYARSLPVLSGQSIGNHIRHILEFYDLLLQSRVTGKLNYDLRKHGCWLEASPKRATERLEFLLHSLAALDTDFPLQLETGLSPESRKPVAVETSFARELLYNLEHAVHHMAIVRIGLSNACPGFPLPEAFGVAFETRRHRRVSLD